MTVVETLAGPGLSESFMTRRLRRRSRSGSRIEPSAHSSDPMWRVNSLLTRFDRSFRDGVERRSPSEPRCGWRPLSERCGGGSNPCGAPTPGWGFPVGWVLRVPPRSRSARDHGVHRKRLRVHGNGRPAAHRGRHSDGGGRSSSTPLVLFRPVTNRICGRRKTLNLRKTKPKSGKTPPNSVRRCFAPIYGGNLSPSGHATRSDRASAGVAESVEGRFADLGAELGIVDTHALTRGEAQHADLSLVLVVVHGVGRFSGRFHGVDR